MSRLKTAFKATAALQVFDYASKLIALVAIPLYLQYLGMEEWGLIQVGQYWAGYLVLTSGGLSSSTMILVSHAHGKGDSAELAKIIRVALLLSALAVLIVAVVTLAVFLVLGVPSFAAWSKFDHPQARWVFVAIGAQVMVSLGFSAFYDLTIGVQQTVRATVFQGTSRLVGQVASLIVAVSIGQPAAVIGAAVASAFLVHLVCAVGTVRRWPDAFRRVAIEKAQVVLQLKTGAKSLGLQLGALLTASAPIWAITQVARPSYVPLYSIPNQLLAMVSSLVISFSAAMQPAFGEAWAKGDMPWIRQTISGVLEKIILLMAASVAGLLAVGPALLEEWLGLKVPVAMVASVAIIGLSNTFVAWCKNLLSGINQHRIAAGSEIANGVLSFAFAWWVARHWSPDYVGLAVFAAGLMTSYWILPREVRRRLGLDRLRPGYVTQGKILLTTLVVFGISAVTLRFGADLPPSLGWATIAAAIAVGVFTFLVATSAFRLIPWSAYLKRVAAKA